MSVNNNERLAVLETEVKNIKNTTERIESKLDSFQSSFATKEEHKENVNRIDYLNKSVSGINIKIALATGGFTTLLYVLDKIFK